MAPVLGYWNIRGLAEPIRYLLHYLQVDFEDKRYEFGPKPNYFVTEWSKNDQNRLGLKLPNLPYYIDGDVKISQSLAIMRHLARKHKLYYPTNEKEIVSFEDMEGHASELVQGLAFSAYNPLFETYKEMYATMVQGKLKMTSDFLSGNAWLFGDGISHIDFILYEALSALVMYVPTCLDAHDNLKTFRKRIEDLSGVAKYRETSLKWPLFSPMAFWGGKGDPPAGV